MFAHILHVYIIENTLAQQKMAKNSHIVLRSQNQEYKGISMDYGLHSCASALAHCASVTVLGCLKKGGGGGGEEEEEEEEEEELVQMRFLSFSG